MRPALRLSVVTIVLAVAPAACSSGSAPASPTSPSGTPTLAACALLSNGTSYLVTQDLSQASSLGPCLQVTGRNNIQVDCQGHSVSGVAVQSSSDVALSNCTLTASLTIAESGQTTVTHSTLSGGVIVAGSSAVTIDHSQIGPAAGAVIAVTITTSTNVTLSQNTIAITSNAGDEAVLFTRGTNNQLLQNTITSTYVGVAQAGTDDGVLLENETGPTIRDNTISGFWDTAVEGVDAVSGAMILNNTMSKIGTAAIGAYWCTDWTNNTIQGNDVSQSAKLALVNYQTGTPQCGPTFTPAVFSGNQFIGNKLHDVIPGFGGLNHPKMSIVFDGGDAENNVLRDNDFGANDGPFLSPLTGFADAGGNVCGPTNPSLSNFPCATGSATHRRHPG